MNEPPGRHIATRHAKTRHITLLRVYDILQKFALCCSLYYNRQWIRQHSSNRLRLCFSIPHAMASGGVFSKFAFPALTILTT